jgi:hypothetical protein
VNSSTGGARRTVGLEWTADLTFEHEGQIAARLRSDARGCVFEIAGCGALFALGRLPLKGLVANASEDSLARLASLMPQEIDLSLSDTHIGRYEPSGPLNWWSRALGLPFGCLTIDKVAFARASLLGGHLTVLTSG